MAADINPTVRRRRLGAELRRLRKDSGLTSSQAAERPSVTVEQATRHLKVRLRRQHRIYDPASPLRLWVVLDESALHRVVGSPEIMREQLEHLNALAAEPHITVRVLPYAAGAHPGLAGQFSLLRFADGPQTEVVYLKRFTSDLHLERESDLQRFGMMYDRLQAGALSPDGTRDLITRAVKCHIDAASGPRAHEAGRQGPS
ncbi:DUF5753 domain-containing protein [Streptomyces sp. SLBN-31]|jgi:hypothetical protein|uniref:DUF5753 domain-containing protein n=1 Tax=Streptomyces sp. SLBN-31 TaxID=2768444 RepID=UPI00115219E5|nr:DUF5753 domain-containing protein [Streptomyces sp. SLBN-31]TQJ75647.1 hypothetical protein FBY22_8696 [Streptomyces sp. SLBN-31]